MFAAMGYFVWYKPRQCNQKGPDQNANVATWAWNTTDGKCYPSTCSQGTLNTTTHTCDIVLKQ